MRPVAFRLSPRTTGVGLVIATCVAVRASALQPAAPRALDTNGPITYFIADGSVDTGFRRSDRQLALWALEAWQRHAGGPIRLEPSRESDALLRVYWAEPGGGQYGEMRPLVVGGRRGAAVFIRPDMDALGAAIARRAGGDVLLRETIVYLTCLHELGHALGLNHTADFRDIMYFFGYGGNIVEYFDRYRRQLASRNDIATVSGLSDADVGRVKELYSR